MIRFQVFHNALQLLTRANSRVSGLQHFLFRFDMPSHASQGQSNTIKGENSPKLEASSTQQRHLSIAVLVVVESEMD